MDKVDYAFNLLKKFGVKTINDLSLVNASMRPSGESYRDRLIAHQPNHNPSELIDELLKQNHGYLVFQEDVIAFLQKICGLSGSEADNVRRAIGRKQMDRLQKALPQILEGYCKMSDKPRDIAEKEAKTFLKIIEDASSYMFGYNHSTGYSMIGYLCAYMRYYYTIEFCTAYLNCSESDIDIYNGTILAKERGINIKNPIFRYSTTEFSCNKNTNTIYKGIGSIKNIGKNCGDNLYTLKDNKYNTFYELLDDIKKNSLATKSELTILIKIGFFEEFGDINLLLKQLDLYLTLFKRTTLKKANCKELYYIDESTVKPYCEKETEKQFSGINIINILNCNINNIPYIKSTLLTKIHYELELLGYTNIVASDSTCYGVESEEVNKYGTPYVSLYEISTGRSKSFKVDRNWYKDYGVKQGDILHCIFNSKNKSKKVMQKDGTYKWIKTDEKETIIKMYSKVILE